MNDISGTAETTIQWSYFVYRYSLWHVPAHGQQTTLKMGVARVTWPICTRATICYRGTCRHSVSVRPAQVGVVQRRL